MLALFLSFLHFYNPKIWRKKNKIVLYLKYAGVWIIVNFVSLSNTASSCVISTADHNKVILHILTTNGGNNNVSEHRAIPALSAECNIVGKSFRRRRMHLHECHAGANFIGGGNLRRRRKRSFSILDKRDGICSRKLRGNISYSKVMRFFRYMKARGIYERNWEE